MSAAIEKAYRAGWRWGLVCGLVAGSSLVLAALQIGLHFA